MATMSCPKCGDKPCMCSRQWCQEQQCGVPPFNPHHCAGPYALTGESRIGDRPCCANLKKCHDEYNIHQWCSSTGKCPGEFKPGYAFPPAPDPFREYSAIIVPKSQKNQTCENFPLNKSGNPPSGRRGTYSRMGGL